MTKKWLCVWLAMSILLGARGALASDARDVSVGLVLGVSEDGSFICQSTEGPEFLVLAGEGTEYRLDRPLAPGMLVEVLHGGMGDTVPPQATATFVRQYLYCGNTAGVDVDGSRFMLNEISMGPLWVLAPAGLDVAALDGRPVAFYPEPVNGVHFQEMVAAGDDLRVLEQMQEARVLSVGGDFLTVEHEGRETRLAMTDQTKVAAPLEPDAMVYVVYDQPVDGAEMVAVGVIGVNG